MKISFFCVNILINVHKYFLFAPGTPIMSIDAYLANAAVKTHVNNSKASLVSGDTSLNNIQVKKNTHGTQTTDQYAQYTKTFSMRNADLETQVCRGKCESI